MHSSCMAFFMLNASNTIFVIIDVQGKLAQMMFEREKTVKNIQGVIRLAQILGIPILWTEQVPQKIGVTIPEVASLLKGQNPICKVSFSCAGEEAFLSALKRSKRKQVVIAGIETHVCVYQTAAELVEFNYEVQVVADAVSSRTAENRSLGLERIEQSGAGITGLEIVACELLKKAEGDKFKEVLGIIK